MKKAILSGLLIGLCTIAYSQENTEAQIIEVYGDSTCLNWKNDNPALYSLMTNFLERGVKIENTNAKYDLSPLLTEIKLRSKEDQAISIEAFLEDYHSGNFNALKYSFFPTQAIQIYRIGGGKVLIIDNQPNLQ